MRNVGPYELIDEVARGGMGVVYRARDPRMGREVALKLLGSDAFRDEELRTRFQREAEALARLSHPGIVTVHAFDWERGAPYLVMELVKGESLQRRLERQGPFAPAEARALGAQLARALAEAHEAGVLHRDLKPENVILRAEDGQPVIVDFGLAQVADTKQRLTQTGTVLGTPSYMAPEQAGAPGQVGVAADVYGLGATLYALLTGEPPFSGPSALSILSKVVQQAPAAPSSLRPGIGVDLEALCLRCLEKDPAQRPAGASALADALERLPRDGGVRSRGSVWLVLAAAGALTALVLVGALLATPGDREDSPAAAVTTETLASPPKEPVARLVRSASGSSKEALRHVRSGDRAWWSGRYADAERSYRLALQFDPDQVQALLGMGRFRFLLFDHEGALERLERVPLEPTEVAREAALLRVRCLARLERREEASRLASNLEERGGSVYHGRLAQGWARLAWCERRFSSEGAKALPDIRREVERAEEDMQEARRAAGANQTLRGRTYALEGRLRLLEANIVPAERQGRIRLARKQTAKGIGHVLAKEAASDGSDTPERVHALRELRRVYFWASLKDSEGLARHAALDSLREQLELEPHNPEFWTYAGHVHVRRENYGEAATALDEAQRAWPTYPGVFLNRAGLYLAKGEAAARKSEHRFAHRQLELARECLQRTRDLAPPTAPMWMAQVRGQEAWAVRIEARLPAEDRR